MSSGLIDIMKRSALDAIDNSKPCDLKYGTVISEKPLKIKVTNQFILPESMLIVPEYLTDYEIEVTIKPDYEWRTQDKMVSTGDITAVATHNHDIYFERKKIKIHGALKVNDKVVLIRQAGGQNFLVVDRLPKEK